MDVTLLYFDDCPNWRDADARLRALEHEHPELHVTRHIVDTPEEAERTRFRGSPSILIDGVDPFADADAPVGLSCRVYPTPTARPALRRSTSSARSSPMAEREPGRGTTSLRNPEEIAQ